MAVQLEADVKKVVIPILLNYFASIQANKDVMNLVLQTRALAVSLEASVPNIWQSVMADVIAGLQADLTAELAKLNTPPPVA